MGFRMRKSFKIAPGIKLNVGTKSVGISMGVKGISHSINSRTGSRTTVGIPGTGISYSKSHKSNAYKRNNELMKMQKQQSMMEEIESNKLEVELYENKIDMIKSIHKEVDDSTDWVTLANSQPNFNPELGQKGIYEINAINEFENYKPSFMDKLSSKADNKTNELIRNIELAKQKDIEEYYYGKRIVDLAKRICNSEVEAYFEAIEESKPLDDLLEFGSGFEFFMDKNNVMEVEFDVNTDNVLPKEKKVLTKTGKISSKVMSKTEYYDIQQDYICSCIIRVARDMFALLPIEYVAINALDERLNTATGLIEKQVILSVIIDKSGLNRLNMDYIDPSDSMQNFKCNMSFKKTTGLGKVTRVLED